MKNRYSRQMAIPEIGKEGQKRISEGKIFIIGSGALGSMVAMQLAGAGVGTLGIADYDNVDVSNLQRQFFFTTEESGKSKVELIGKRIKDLNPYVAIRLYKEMITVEKAKKIFKEYDFIVDATDNPESKRMTGSISAFYGKACCIGGVRDFTGQVITLLPGDSRFEDFFGEASAEGFLPCSLSGVIGPAAALCASLQASEAIKFVAGLGNILSGRLLCFNLLDDSFKLFNI